MQSNDHLMDKYTAFHSYGHALMLAKAQEQAVQDAADSRSEGEDASASLRVAKPFCIPRVICYLP